MQNVNQPPSYTGLAKEHRRLRYQDFEEYPLDQCILRYPEGQPIDMNSVNDVARPH